MTVRIVLVDDHDLVRRGLSLLLEFETGFEVVGEAQDAIEAIETTRRLRPDVLIVDMVLPNGNGIEVTREIKRHLPETQVILLSMYDSPAYVTNAFQAGAQGYVLKRSKPDELLLAIRSVLAGNHYLSSELNQDALIDYAQYLKKEAGDEFFQTLTEREQQVFRMAARGVSNPEIARALSLSTRTIETHRANLLRKLNLKNQTELVRYAVKNGLVE
jgi:DNA-binding NarL/FixJ family response regulator